MDQPRTALLVIDMQRESKYGIEGMDEAVAGTAALADACRTHGVPVIYTRHISRADAVGLPNGEVRDVEGRPVYYRSGTDSAEVVRELAPRPGDIVIDKHRWSGFYGTPLDLVLRDLGADHLIVTGFVTDGCVLTTVFDAYARNYRVCLVKDATAATNAGSHKAAVLMMANWVYDIEVLDAAEAVKKISGEAYASWTSTGPDQCQFTGGSLDAVYAALTPADRR